MGHLHPSEALAARWRMSSYTDRGSCVAVACRGTDVAVRNSNWPDAGTLLFSVQAMHAWIAGIKAGEFDDLTMHC
jgi:hypothetical protein